VRRIALALLVGATGCEGTLPPLRKVGEVGKEPILLFVGGEFTGQADLFAVPASGGQVTQLTFSSVNETRPALSPDGRAVAFLRPGAVWVLNLLSGAEREVRLPKGAGTPERVGWAADGRSLVVAAGTVLYRAPTPPDESPATVVPPSARASAESSLAVLLGSPAFARVTTCPEPEDLCLVGDTGGPAPLAAGARDAARWGDDSVSYFTNAGLVVRPLGPGRERVVELTNPPPRPREPTMFPGAGPAVSP
jgi:hypothetical protein